MPQHCGQLHRGQARICTEPVYIWGSAEWNAACLINKTFAFKIGPQWRSMQYSGITMTQIKYINDESRKKKKVFFSFFFFLRIEWHFRSCTCKQIPFQFGGGGADNHVFLWLKCFSLPSGCGKDLHKQGKLTNREAAKEMRCNVLSSTFSQ